MPHTRAGHRRHGQNRRHSRRATAGTGRADQALQLHRDDDRAAACRPWAPTSSRPVCSTTSRFTTRSPGSARCFSPPTTRTRWTARSPSRWPRDARGVQAVVALGQWLASPEHPSLMTRQHWLTSKLFALLPETAHVAVDPGFRRQLHELAPVAAQLGVLPMPAGAGRNAHRQ